MGLSKYKNSNLRRFLVSLINFEVLSPDGTILVCLFNGVIYEWPLFEAVIYNCSVVNSACYIYKKVKYTNILQFTNTNNQRKRSFGKLSKNIQRAIILLSKAATSQNFVRQENFRRTLKIFLKKGGFFIKCLMKVIVV